MNVLEPVRGSAWVADLTRPRRILMVDDDEQVFTILQKLAMGMHCEFTRALTCADAVALLSNPEHKFDIVFLDLNMPCANGEECFKTMRTGFIKQLYRLLPVVVFSGFVTEDVKQRMMETDFCLFVDKPADMTRSFVWGMLQCLGVREVGR